LSGRGQYCGTNAGIGSASADIGHCFVNLCIIRTPSFFDERDSGHDLARLAISALGYLRVDPGLLNGVQCSVVVIDFPATSLTGTLQERLISPSICTLHAPHAEMPHPNFVPVKLSSSRIAHNKGVSGSALILTALPFTVA
jgi:hypothetical protein